MKDNYFFPVGQGRKPRPSKVLNRWEELGPELEIRSMLVKNSKRYVHLVRIWGTLQIMIYTHIYVINFYELVHLISGFFFISLPIKHPFSKH